MGMKKIICFGDSITEAPDHSEKDRWTARLQRSFEERTPGQIAVHNAGICGQTSADALERLPEDVTPHLPATVLIEFGLNDANIRPWLAVSRISVSEFTRNIAEICRVVQTGKGTPILVINHPVENFPQPNELQSGDRSGMQAYAQAIRDLSKKLSLACIDLPILFKARGITTKELLDLDGVHLSVAGSHHYAEAVFQELLKLLAT
jgi:lysophospholipase L1-like esterase